MLITKDLIITIILALGIGKISDINSPKHYDLITSEGKTVNILIEKHAKYACPLHCASDHYHRTIKSEDDLHEEEIFYTLYGFGSEDMHLNSYEVVDLHKVEVSKKPQKIENINVQTYLP
tara:strand:- start:380 stop:739 length:360 start_codon:yes stop_codon:yes gene_type:complete